MIKKITHVLLIGCVLLSAVVPFGASANGVSHASLVPPLGLEKQVLSEKPVDLQNAKPINPTMFQYFEWDLPNNGKHWTQLKQDAKRLSDVGITSVWLPPASKGVDGKNDVGYSIYDRYDLGEFFQKGSTRTKYGTKAELQDAISSLHKNGIAVYADVVMGQLHGSMGEEEPAMAAEVSPWDRWKLLTDYYPVQVYTKLTYPIRNKKYSSFTWDASKFTGIDYNIADTKLKRQALYLFQGKAWNKNVSMQNGNDDLLIGADVDYSLKDVREETMAWGKWLTDTLNLDGYRIDAARHLDHLFLKEWLEAMRKHTGRPLYAVSEYAWGELAGLERYLNTVNWNQSLFDFELKSQISALVKARGRFDLMNMSYGTLSSNHPNYAVKKVNTHDSQPGQIGDEFYIPISHQPIAYTYTLTRSEGIPVVFYGDYYGIINKGIPGIKEKLDPLLKARSDYAYGKQRDYFNDPDVAGWTREGDPAKPMSGLAALISDQKGGIKKMYVGKAHAHELWRDLSGNQPNPVLIDAHGFGVFSVGAVSWSVYVPDQLPQLMDHVVVYVKDHDRPATRVQYVTLKGQGWSNGKQIALIPSEYAGYQKALIPTDQPIQMVVLDEKQKPRFRVVTKNENEWLSNQKIKTNRWFDLYRNIYTINHGYLTLGAPVVSGETVVLYRNYDSVVMHARVIGESNWVSIPMKPSSRHPLFQEAILPNKELTHVYFAIGDQKDDQNGRFYLLNQYTHRMSSRFAYWMIESDLVKACSVICAATHAEIKPETTTIYYKSDQEVHIRYRNTNQFDREDRAMMKAADEKAGYVKAIINNYEQAWVSFEIKGKQTEWLVFQPGTFYIKQGMKSYYNDFSIENGYEIATLPPKNIALRKIDQIEHRNINGYWIIDWDHELNANGYAVYIDDRYLNGTYWNYIKLPLKDYTLEQLVDHITVRSEFRGVWSEPSLPLTTVITETKP